MAVFIAANDAFLGNDLLPWLLLAFGGALAFGNIMALVRPPVRPEQDALSKAPVGRSVMMIVLGLIPAIWAIASLIKKK